MSAKFRHAAPLQWHELLWYVHDGGEHPYKYIFLSKPMLAWGKNPIKGMNVQQATDLRDWLSAVLP